MSVYDFPESDLNLWRDYMKFHLNYCAGFWSPAEIMRPYGTILFGTKGDWGDSVWQVKKSKAWSIDDIIQDAENLSARNMDKVNFYFNAAYDQDMANQLQTVLPSHGYSRKYDIHWLVMQNLPDLNPIVPAGFSIADATDPESFVKVHQEAFLGQDVTEFYQQQIPTPRSNSNIRLFLLSDPAGEPVAIGGMAWEGEYGNLFTLGVREKWRRQGFGKLMVDWRLKLLADAGVKYIVTGVLADNDASYALQLQKGYRLFAKAESWIKN